MQTGKKESLAVHKFINEYLIENCRIKPRAFNLFHRCSLRCYRNPKADESQVSDCIQACQKSRLGSRGLDDFMENCRHKDEPNIDAKMFKFDKADLETAAKDTPGQDDFMIR